MACRGSSVQLHAQPSAAGHSGAIRHTGSGAAGVQPGRRCHVPAGRAWVRLRSHRLLQCFGAPLCGFRPRSPSPSLLCACTYNPDLRRACDMFPGEETLLVLLWADFIPPLHRLIYSSCAPGQGSQRSGPQRCAIARPAPYICHHSTRCTQDLRSLQSRWASATCCPSRRRAACWRARRRPGATPSATTPPASCASSRLDPLPRTARCVSYLGAGLLQRLSC